MKSLVRLITLSTGLLIVSLATAQPDTSSPPTSKAEAMQLSQDMSPKARSQLAQREANAAYKEAMSACKSMGKAERKDCSSEAKANLRKDLNYAKEIRTSGASMGGSSSGTSSAGYGSDKISGSNDLSTAGSSGSSGGSGMGGGMHGMSGSNASGSDRSGNMHSGRMMDQPTSGMSNESTSNEKLTPAEKQQFVQSFTPQAQYNLAKREAHAAHAEALKACKSLSRSERSACTKDARSSLQQDLAFAKRKMQGAASGTSTGNPMDSGASGAGK
jgi:hypothetical protein